MWLDFFDFIFRQLFFSMMVFQAGVFDSPATEQMNFKTFGFLIN